MRRQDAINIRIGDYLIPQNNKAAPNSSNQLLATHLQKTGMKCLQFPHSRVALWDQCTIGEEIIIHPSHYQNPYIKLDEKVLQLARGYARDSVSSIFHCLAIGSICMNDVDGEGFIFQLDHFDPGVEIAGNAIVPTANTVDKLTVPLMLRNLSSNTKFNQELSKEACITAMKFISESCQSKSRINIHNFLKIHAACGYHATSNDVIFQLKFHLITMATELQASPIRAIPIVPTALAKTLASLDYHLREEPKTGYITMDETRKLLLLVESDPKALSLPLIGIWVSGEIYVYSPFIWVSCHRFLFNAHLQDRVCKPPDPFLLILYSPTRAKPQFFQCIIKDSSSHLNFDLYSGVEKISFKNDLSSRKKFIHVDLFKETNNTIFKEAVIDFQVTNKDSREVVNKMPLQQFNHLKDEILPRTSPKPHPQSLQPSVIQPIVPEVSLVIDDRSSTNDNTSQETISAKKNDGNISRPTLQNQEKPKKPILNSKISFSSRSKTVEKNKRKWPTFLPKSQHLNTNSQSDNEIHQTLSKTSTHQNMKIKSHSFLKLSYQQSKSQNAISQVRFKGTQLPCPKKTSRKIPPPESTQENGQLSLNMSKSHLPSDKPLQTNNITEATKYPVNNIIALNKMSKTVTFTQNSTSQQDLSISIPRFQFHNVYAEESISHNNFSKPVSTDINAIDYNQHFQNDPFPQVLPHQNYTNQDIRRMELLENNFVRPSLEQNVMKSTDNHCEYSLTVNTSQNQYDARTYPLHSTENRTERSPLNQIYPNLQSDSNSSKNPNLTTVTEAKHCKCVTSHTCGHDIPPMMSNNVNRPPVMLMPSNEFPQQNISSHQLIRSSTKIPLSPLSLVHQHLDCSNNGIAKSSLLHNTSEECRIGDLNSYKNPQYTLNSRHPHENEIYTYQPESNNTQQILSRTNQKFSLDLHNSSELITPQNKHQHSKNKHNFSKGIENSYPSIVFPSNNSNLESQDQIRPTVAKPVKSFDNNQKQEIQMGNIASQGQHLNDSDPISSNIYEIIQHQELQLKSLQSQIQQLLQKQSAEPAKQKAKTVSTNTSMVWPSQEIMIPNKNLPDITSMEADINSEETPSAKNVKIVTIVDKNIPVISKLSSSSISENKYAGQTIIPSGSPCQNSDNNKLSSIPQEISINLSELQLPTFHEHPESMMSSVHVDIQSYAASPNETILNGRDNCPSPLLGESASMLQNQTDVVSHETNLLGENMDEVLDQNEHSQRPNIFYRTVLENINKLLQEKCNHPPKERLSLPCPISEEPLRDIPIRRHSEDFSQVNSVNVTLATFRELQKMGVEMNMKETHSFQRLEYVSLIKSFYETDVSTEINTMGMKYLTDDQLVHMAKLNQMPTTSKTTPIHKVLQNPQNTSDITLYGMSINNISFATKKFLEKYSLIPKSKTEGNSLLVRENLSKSEMREPIGDNSSIWLFPEKKSTKSEEKEVNSITKNNENILDIERLKELPKFF